ncbi:hypothetical protein C2W64_04327 [Brevibacillus laterosporus]|nr:hypothetical protein C2W64_04327 [Brevibacillus laterosporus]
MDMDIPPLCETFIQDVERRMEHITPLMCIVYFRIIKKLT